MGSSRRLALEIVDADSTSSATRAHTRALQSDQESAFSMEVQLEKNELDVDVAADGDSNGAAIYAVMTMTGLIGLGTTNCWCIHDVVIFARI